MRPGDELNRDEGALVAAFFREDAIDDAMDSPLPPAGAIWFRAQAARRRVAAERAVTVIRIARYAALLLALAITLALIVWQAPRLAMDLPRTVAAGLAALLTIGGAAIAYTLRALPPDRNSRRGI